MKIIQKDVFAMEITINSRQNSSSDQHNTLVRLEDARAMNFKLNLN